MISISSLPISPQPSSLHVGYLVLGFIAVIATIYAFDIFARWRLVDKDGNAIPPGPRGLPVLGSYPFLTRNLILQVDDWAKQYGSLYSLTVGNQLFMIVSDPQIVKDLMISNGAIFSSRRDVFLRSRTILANRGITASPYGAEWRKHRRISNTVLNTRYVDQTVHRLEVEANRMIVELLTLGQGGIYPVNPLPYAGRYSLNNMLKIAFGTHTDSIDDPLVKEAFGLSREFMQCTGIMANLSDFISVLRHVPNYMYRRCKALHSELVVTYGGMVKDLEMRMIAGEDVPDCLAKTLIQTRREEQLDDLDISMMVSAFLLGGLDSTASIIRWFFVRMAVDSDIQQRAQEELDRVVGRERLPVIEDGNNLPYIRAMIKEIERCHNPFWLCTPHAGTEDYTYRGYYIPKGTALVLNTYAMHHDPQRYPDPFRFNPDRYLEIENPKTAGEPDNWIFGVGRRICPGIRLAEHEIFLAVTRMLWAFRIEQVRDHPIDIKQYRNPAKGHPTEVQLRMIVRHEKVLEVLTSDTRS